MVNKSWNDGKSQIHCNKLEWVNPRNCIEGKNIFFVSYKKICLGDNNKTAHWVVHSKLKFLGIEDLLKEKPSLMN